MNLNLDDIRKNFPPLLPILIGLLALLAISCGKHNKMELMTSEESFHRAMEKFNRGKYLDASEQLTMVTLNYSGSSIIDSAQYFLGESHFRMKEYIIAASEFQRLLNQFPSSHLSDDAKFKIGLCYYKLSPKYSLDQEYTLKAIYEFQEFTEFFPSSELVPQVMDMIFTARNRLAKKSYKNGVLYYKMHDFDSAIIYLDEVLDYYYDTEFAPKALLKKGESYLKMKRPEEAVEIFRRLQEKYPGTQASAKSLKYLNSTQVEIEKD